MGIPVTVVTGFLGSGKTTLINEIIKQTEIPAEEIVIIINELGEVNIDHQLLIHEKEEIFQLNNGCICCNLRADLASTLQAILEILSEQERTVQKVIIETTGIADPQPVIQTIYLSPFLSSYFYIDSVLTVVDCVNYQANLSVYPEAYKQISMADRFILSKVDESFFTSEEVIKSNLAKINPLADFRTFSLTENYLENDFFDLQLFHDLPEKFKETEAHLAHDHHEHGHEHHHHDHSHEGFQSIYLTTDQILDENLFCMWLDWLLVNFSGKLYRYKGILNLANREVPIALQGVSVHYRFELVNQLTKENIQSQIVLIGNELDVKTIHDAFEELIQLSYVKD
ncbi:CobW family GTP-binding protein [Jeotgalibaca ciconiae]|uniref:GTP-binding protein n=1 Tax=Jeotgalibaca ciconiae TaxID=2496265 RepID=A0A3Q9BL93_9LACT|nr:GTP-binding protein [Jeotgalibaca ciconiae]AZP03609.1 GTP-binding protein [Jeotgalibaca ciconiae]